MGWPPSKPLQRKIPTPDIRPVVATASIAPLIIAGPEL